MSCQKDLLVLLSFAFVLVISIRADHHLPDDNIGVKFSRLLNQQPELLRYTSISSDPASASHDVNKEYRRGFAIKKSDAANILAAQSVFPRDYLHGQPATVQVQHSVREEISTNEGTLTNINQKPISRIPVSVLRQSSGNNRLNISPVFVESDNAGNRRRPLVENVTEKIQEPEVSEEHGEVTTTNPEYYDENLTTEKEAGLQEEIVVPITPAKETPAPTENLETPTTKIVFDNRTTPSTTPATTTTTTTTTEKFEEEDNKENLIAESFNRKGQFLDFEDSPSHLVTAETSQPARVNVRPASSGKDYEYEYIYYYYDDDDEDNSTSTKSPNEASAQSPAPTPIPKIETEHVKVADEFAPEKIQTTKLSSQSNALERTRESKTIQVDYENQNLGDIQDSPAQDYQEAHVPQQQATAADYQDEPVKILRPKASAPILLKQSNLAPSFTPSSSIPPATTTTTTTTTTEKEVPVTTSEVPASRQAGSRFRSKDRFDAPRLNKVPTEAVTTTSTEEPIRRPSYKDTPRRTPTRRPVQNLQVEEPVTVPEKVKEKSKVKIQSEEPRPSTRTRFPPRVHATQVPEAVNPAPITDVVPSNSIVESVPTRQSPSVTQPSGFDDKKAKDNFARTKSINDLYALTRLHQLAINTRIPNRKSEPTPVYKGTPPKIAGGFLNSAESITQLPEDHIGSETTTITSFIPANHVASQVTSTTEQATVSSSAPTEEHFGGKRNRFAGRRRPTQATSTTSTEAPARPSSPNRFGGRRRTFAAPTEVVSSAAPEEGSPVQESAPSSAAPAPSVSPVLRQRNRFAGRTRQPTAAATTEITENGPAAAVEEVTKATLPRRRERPQGSFGANRRRPLSAARDPTAAPSADSPVETPAPSVAAIVEPERRTPNNLRPRNRPGAGGVGPIGGRPLRLRKTTTTTTEVPEPIVAHEEIAVEQSPTVHTEQIEVPISTVGQQVTVLSSTTVVETPAEPTQLPKRGSAAALGRLRPKGRPAPLPTTQAPEVTTTSRKPSRLNGILNRKKFTPTTTAAPAHSEHIEGHEETQDNGQEQEEPLPKGTIVQVSTIVSQSEEGPDHHGEVIDEHVSTTQGSILNRLKSQRKPGSLFRKRVE